MLDNLEENNLEQPIEETSQLAPRKQLDKNQKVAMAILGFFAILVFIAWAIQFNNNLNKPFKINSVDNTSQSGTSQDGTSATLGDEALRQKDTDKDGLSDYDELRVYNTSPYLEDSDSDGYSDKQELDSQNDPNCPIGQQCYSEPELIESPISSQSENLLSIPTNSTKAFDPEASSASASSATAKTPAELRAMLSEAGMDQATLDVLSDEALVSTYNDAFSKNESTVSTPATDTSQTILEGKADAASLRALLLESGMSQAILDSIGDEELMQSYNDSLAN